VARFKSNKPLQVVVTPELPGRSAILSDQIRFLPTRQAGRQQNPMHRCAINALLRPPEPAVRIDQLVLL
jgi:hypothetical protein